tara:strand:- start:2142 stop:2315 length:174 start_codon:yes stop_codon:yes gene_type:complete
MTREENVTAVQMAMIKQNNQAVGLTMYGSQIITFTEREIDYVREWSNDKLIEWLSKW